MIVSVTYDRLAIRFAPPADGWIDVTIQLPPEVVRFSASYTPADSVSELVGVLLRVLHSPSEGEVIWNEEPDTIHTLFRRRGDLAELRVDAVSGSRRSTLFKHEASVVDVVRPFCNALRDLQAVTAAARYQASWRYPFPHESLERLVQRVAP
jgi:hypothetical protein